MKILISFPDVEDNEAIRGHLYKQYPQIHTRMPDMLITEYWNYRPHTVICSPENALFLLQRTKTEKHQKFFCIVIDKYQSMSLSYRVQLEEHGADIIFNGNPYISDLYSYMRRAEEDRLIANRVILTVKDNQIFITHSK